MLFLQFFHEDELLYVAGKKYTATCRVRNELNRWRDSDDIVKTYPLYGPRLPYYPRKFPTGLWKVKETIFTNEPEYAPVKITTDAVRRVMTREEKAGEYGNISGEVQEDSFYHLHYCSGSSTTLGCIRLDSSEDAIEIAKLIRFYLQKEQPVWLEVNIKRG